MERFGINMKIQGIQLVDVKQAEIHNTELLVRAINRRLESYGKVMYRPEYSNSDVHLEQYTELENRVYGFLMKRFMTFYTDENGYTRSKLRDNITGRKGTYIQISRSREFLEDLIPYQNELRQIVALTPTWQQLQEQAEQEAGKKLTRKEKVEMIKRMSTIKKVMSMTTFLGESDSVDETDVVLAQLLMPFRSKSKGGTREKGQKVSQADWDALFDYLVQQYTDHSLIDDYDEYYGDKKQEQKFDSSVTNSDGLLDFSKSKKSL